jgi:hypothetical protein
MSLWKMAMFKLSGGWSFELRRLEMLVSRCCAGCQEAQGLDQQTLALGVCLSLARLSDRVVPPSGRWMLP